MDTHVLQLSARRYVELLEIADRMLKTSRFIENLIVNPSEIDEKIRPLFGVLPDCRSQCPIVALDYSISALEAFINHIGYIAHSNWLNKYEGKIFGISIKRL